MLFNLLPLLVTGAVAAALGDPAIDTPIEQTHTPQPVNVENECLLPRAYHIKDFVGKTNGTKADTPVLVSFNFKFEDPLTKVSTSCQWNTSSVSTTPAGLTPRFPCENRVVKFIWESAKGLLTSIETFCPAKDGKLVAEVSGSVDLKLDCNAKGDCAAKSAETLGTFISVGPIMDPTL